MRKLFKWAFRLLLLVCILVVLFVMFRNMAIRLWAEQVIQRETGMEAIVGKVVFKLNSPRLRIENLRLINTPEFGGTTFIDLPELDIVYDPIALATRRHIRLEEVRCNLVELHIVEGIDGDTNMKELQKRMVARGLFQRLADEGFTFEGAEDVVLSFERFKFTSLKRPSRDREVEIDAYLVPVKNIRSFSGLGTALGHMAARRGTNAATWYFLGSAGAARAAQFTPPIVPENGG